MNEMVYGSKGKWNTATPEICIVEVATSERIGSSRYSSYQHRKIRGMNNKIKVAKRIAYGYRDEDYFFTLIRYQRSLGFPTIP